MDRDGGLREDAADLAEPLLQVLGVDGGPSHGGVLVQPCLVQPFQSCLCGFGD
jgi:hypothetical protein